MSLLMSVLLLLILCSILFNLFEIRSGAIQNWVNFIRLEHLANGTALGMSAAPSERFNTSYDRERLCLSRTHGYVYPLQWREFSDPVIIWEWNRSARAAEIRPDYS